MRRKVKGLLLLLFILSLALPGASLNRQSPRSSAGSPLGFAKSSYQPLPSARTGSSYQYDEQVGITFTEDFSNLAFNVTAVALTDPPGDPYGVGPGYLVNGLTDRGYWYQVGLSYNWPLTSGAVNQGFNMNYEVFDSGGSSIDPSSGGGLQSFGGTVNAGDVVLLSLSFSSGSVVMRAMDWQTRAVSSHSYTAIGSIFIGLRSSLSNQFGFFTGLMTEQYHSSPYYGAGLPVAYNDIGASLSSAWMWIDEWNTVSDQTVFRDNTTLPVSFDKSIGQYFSSNGTAEVASAHGLVTGLTPVAIPTLDASIAATGPPGSQVSFLIVIVDPQGATVRFTNMNITTSFGRYNFTLGSPFSFYTGTGQYKVTIGVPASVSPGNYDLTIDVLSWQYLEIQAQEWISLQRVRVIGTLVLTNSPFPPTHQGSNPPSSGQGPSTSTNRTTLSLSSLLGLFRTIIIPVTAGYASLGLLAVVLLVQQRRKRSTNGPIPILRFCQGCGVEINIGELTCSSCGLFIGTSTHPENQSSVTPNSSELAS